MTVRLMVRRGFRRRLARTCCLICAAVCLGLYAYAFVERSVYQTYESHAFDGLAGAATPLAGSVEAIPAGKPPVRAARPAATPLIGRLSIARLHWSAMVREGVEPADLRLAVGHIPATALPGEGGNVGLAGHRDTFFSALKRVQPGDEIRFSTRTGEFAYTVESLLIVEPEDASVLATSAENALTLVTCYPFSYIGAAPKRFVVRARQTSPREIGE